MPPKPDLPTNFLNDIERALPDHHMVFVAGGDFLMGGQNTSIGFRLVLALQSAGR